MNKQTRSIGDLYVRAARAALKGELPHKRIDRLRPSRDGARCAESPIPRLVHQTWLTNRFGRTHAQGLTRFRDENPEMEFRLWDNAERDAFVAHEFGDHPISAVYFGAQFGPMAADIWRYLVLIRLGGWYFDINKCVLSGLARLANLDCDLIVSYEQNSFTLTHPAPNGLTHPQNVVCNWGIGAAPKSPVLTRVIDDICNDAPVYKDKVWQKPKEAIIDFTGPRRLTRTIHSHVAEFGTAGIYQAGIDFHGSGVFDMPGSDVRYLTSPPYAAERNAPILP